SGEEDEDGGREAPGLRMPVLPTGGRQRREDGVLEVQPDGNAVLLQQSLESQQVLAFGAAVRAGGEMLLELGALGRRQLAVDLQVQPFAVGVVVRPLHDSAPRRRSPSQSLRKSCNFSFSICLPRNSLFFTVPRGICLSWAISS